MSRARSLKQLLENKRGASIIEFAIVAPAFFAIVVAIIETSFMFLASDGLETATENASRMLLTGQAQRSGFDRSQFKTAACADLPSYLKCTNLMVDVQTSSNFSSAEVSPPVITYDIYGNVTNTFNYSPGSGGAIVVVRLMYLWPTLTGPLGFNLADQPRGKRLLVATSVIKAEAY
jgi:TadE-like protein.